MVNIASFFRNQRPIFDDSISLLNKLSTESEYLQAEQEAINALSRIREIIGMQKPYKKIADLPDLIQKVQMVYNQLLLLKKQEVYAEIQSAMGEIHQAARFDQKNVIEKADDVLSAKKKSAAETPTLTQLDAMKIQIGNIRQQYIKALMIPMNPQEKIATAYRSSLGYSIKLKNEADIDKYVADIKEKLLEMLKGNDALHII